MQRGKKDMSVYIIAEAGVNHNGDIAIAKKMIEKAKEAGADCIKFQTFVAKNLVSKNARKAAYQIKSGDGEENQLRMLEKLELSFKDFEQLNECCRKKEIEFLSTAFDLESINFLSTLDMQRWKIPSGDITNLPYLIRIAQLKKPVILSTGMSSMPEIESAMRVLKTNGAGDITLLHCTTEYPAPYGEVNLSAMDTMRSHFGVDVGYSDHTIGTEVAIAAVALGAAVIEKHFTLDRYMQGPDHQSSIEPDELHSMVHAIRNIEKALGTGEKIPTESEKRNINVVRKSIVAKDKIAKGDVFNENNLTTKRPGDGISPMLWYEVIGKTAAKDFEEDELITL